MKWEEYYFKFYGWAKSTQISRISSLTDFTSSDEICQVARLFDEKGASKLIRKALSQNVSFTAEEIMNLLGYVEKECLISLIKSCKEPFTLAQLSHMGNHSLLYTSEIYELIPTKLAFDNSTWEEYYNVFNELSDEEKVLGAMSVVDFSSVGEVADEICGIVLELDETSFSELIQKALSQNVIFTAEQITTLSECAEKEPLISLIKSCKEPFTLAQISQMNDCSPLCASEIDEIISTKLVFNDVTWEAYYNVFHDLSDEDKMRGAMKITDFSSVDEVKEVILNIAEYPNAETFIFKALDSGITLSTSEIEELIEFDNKKLNRRLVFDNLHKLKKVIAFDEFDYLESYMYAEDFKKLKRKIGYTEPVYEKPIYEKPPKIPFWAKVGAVMFGVKLANHLFGDDNKKDKD